MTIEARIRADIERRIRSGEWAPGTRIPYEHELVAEHRCARATVNKALSSLAREGLIERRRRAGSFVARPPVRSAVVGVPDIAALLVQRGEAYRWELLDLAARGTAPTVVERGGPWLALHGVHHGGERAFAVEKRWIDLATVPEAVEVDFETEPPGSWLLAHVPWTEARHRVSAVAAGVEGKRLGVAAGTPCLQLERWTWRSGRPVTYARQLFPGDRYDLVEDFTP